MAVTLACLGWILGGASGCSRSDTAPTATQPATPQQAATPERTSDRPTASTEPRLQEKSPGAEAEKTKKPAEVVTSPEPAAATARRTPGQVLEAMVDAYQKATSYSDKGMLRVQAKQEGKKVDEPSDFSLVMTRPNKIRLQSLMGVMVCDGRDVVSFVNDLPDQVAKRQAPPSIDMKTVLSDEILAKAISQGPTAALAWGPVPLLLMVAEKPLLTLMHGCQKTALLEPEKIGSRQCYRVELTRTDGKAVLWIDDQTFVLRRMEYPTEELMRSATDAKLEELTIVAEFQDAGFNDKVDDKLFQYEIPGGARTVECLMPPPLLMLGKPAPEFTFVGADGKPIDLKTIAGKVTILDFWATWCGPCRASLPLMEKIYKKYKDNPRSVAFLAVSVDVPKVVDKEVKSTLDELAVTIPFARDPDQHAGKRFGVMGVPSTYVLGANKLIEDSEEGYNPNLESQLSQKIDKLLSGPGYLHGTPEAFRSREEEIR